MLFVPLLSTPCLFNLYAIALKKSFIVGGSSCSLVLLYIANKNLKSFKLYWYFQIYTMSTVITCVM